MENEKKSEKIEYPIGDYHKVWDKVIPIPIKQFEYKKGSTYLYGSRLRLKMIQFLTEAKFTKTAYDHYLNMGPAREPDEVYEDYKIRQRFQKALEKYKNIVQLVVFENFIKDLQNNPIINK